MKVGLVLCGGNIDARMLAVVLNREMVRERRLIVYRILGDDRPGMLSAMAAVIGGLGGNIIDVVHNRLALDVPAKGAEFDIMVETRDSAHADADRTGFEGPGLCASDGLRRLASSQQFRFWRWPAVTATPRPVADLRQRTPGRRPSSWRSNGKEEGVQTLPSRLQYKVIQSGPSGAASPDRNDLVRVDYEGALTDGTVFDSSFSRGQPYVTTAEQVVPGWTEALQRMKVGDEWILYVPPALGYGERGQGMDIPPNSVLVFRIKLLDVAPAPGGGRGTGLATG